MHENRFFLQLDWVMPLNDITCSKRQKQTSVFFFLNRIWTAAATKQFALEKRGNLRIYSQNKQTMNLLSWKKNSKCNHTKSVLSTTSVCSILFQKKHRIKSVYSHQNQEQSVYFRGHPYRDPCSQKYMKNMLWNVWRVHFRLIYPPIEKCTYFMECS